MERKLISQGGGGFTVYLPKKWVKDHKLSKGDELSIAISGKDLILSVKPSTKKTETEIILVNLVETSIRTLIVNTYRKGYDSIKVNFSSKEQYDILQKVLKTRILGFEIVNKEINYCIVESVTEPSEDQFDNIIRKIFLNIDELFEITKNKFNLIETEDVKEIADRIERYDNFCRRVIFKQKFIKPDSEMFLVFLTLIIHAERELYFLNKNLKIEKKISKDIEELFDGAYKIFKSIENAFFERDIKLLAEVHKLEKEYIYKKTYDLLRTKKGNDNIIIYHLASCIRRFYQSNSPLTGLII